MEKRKSIIRKIILFTVFFIMVGSMSGCYSIKIEMIEDLQPPPILLHPKIVRDGDIETSLSTTNNNYLVITDNIGSISADQPILLPPEQYVTIMFGENSTEYYTVVETFNTGRITPFYKPVELPKADTFLNDFFAKNVDGSENSVGNPELTTKRTYETEVWMKAGRGTYFGNPTNDCKNIGVVEYDPIYYQSIKGKNLGYLPDACLLKKGNKASSLLIPKFGGTGQVAYAKFQINITRTDKNSSLAPPLILHIFDCDVDKDEEDLTLIYDVEDEDMNLLSLAPQKLLIYTNEWKGR